MKLVDKIAIQHSTLEYLRKYEHGSRRHVEFELIAEIGNRMGAARSIDIEDLNEEKSKIKFTHRPEKDHPDVLGTPLKNRKDGQRHQSISPDLMDLIQSYLDNPDREDTEDKFGRKPLFTTENGRVTRSTFRRDFYKVTRPCVYSDSCPHDRDPETCEATNNNNASGCPSSYTPHPLRRWSIERHIDRGMPKEQLSDRVDVSVPVLEKHYDTRSEERKRQQRLKIMEKLFPKYGDPDATIDSDLIEEDILDSSRSPLEVDVIESAMEDVENRDAIEAAQSDNEPELDGSESGDEKPDEAQTTFNEFSDGVMGVPHLGIWPAFVAVAGGKWVHGRLNREFIALASQPGTSLTPSAERGAKGAAAYVVFVCLLSINLGLLGAPFTTLF